MRPIRLDTKPRKETDISKDIGQYLTARGIYNVRIQSGRLKRGKDFIHLAPTGTPDRAATYRGLAIWIEVKKPGETPSDKQLETHDAIRRSGGRVIVAECLDQVIEGFAKIDQELGSSNGK
jgi:hypothetical protein